MATASMYREAIEAEEIEVISLSKALSSLVGSLYQNKSAKRLVPSDNALGNKLKEYREENYSLRFELSNTSSKLSLMSSGSSDRTAMIKATLEGDTETVLAMLASGYPINDLLSRSATPLLNAIRGGHLLLGRKLLDMKADPNMPAPHTMFTPLMGAASFCRGLVADLLEQNADPHALNNRKMTALSYAIQFGNKKTIDLLTMAEKTVPLPVTKIDQKSKKDNVSVCPVCGAFFRIDRLRRITNRVKRNEEINPYVVEFVNSPVCARFHKDAFFHISLHCTKLRKEITESWAMIKVLETLVKQLEIDSQRTFGIIDLCCGKCMTSSMLSVRFPRAQVLSVDRYHENAAPHFAPNQTYLCADILDDSIFGKLSNTINNPGGKQSSPTDMPILACGMHLCGTLSPRAIDIVSKNPNILGLVLSPCCLPSKKCGMSCPGASQPEQYYEWCRSLLFVFSEQFMFYNISIRCLEAYMKHTMDHVVFSKDQNIMSQRDGVVYGWKSKGSTRFKDPLGKALFDNYQANKSVFQLVSMYSSTRA
eukprot:m.209867 g.209867  ORF g.209867 m.209867 type:complete len:536 (+) comp15820_c0_seq5:270-1877(+)